MVPRTNSISESTLTQRHFVMQHERPSHIGEVDLFTLQPALRTLLFTDGTVTRTLEAQTLSRVFVEVIGQTQIAATKEIADHLDLKSNSDSIRRRVVITSGASTTPVIWAESHIIPTRLPAGFLGILDDAREGIGGSLQQVRLESWRELLWFGIDSPPDWALDSPRPDQTVLSRLYRVITQGRPALLILESFAIERRAAVYHLASATTVDQ